MPMSHTVCLLTTRWHDRPTSLEIIGNNMKTRHFLNTKSPRLNLAK
eukprot:COSAG02_NODE_26736_length_626_cov_0.557875_1_plen_45_part_10